MDTSPDAQVIDVKDLENLNVTQSWELNGFLFLGIFLSPFDALEWWIFLFLNPKDDTQTSLFLSVFFLCLSLRRTTRAVQGTTAMATRQN